MPAIVHDLTIEQGASYEKHFGIRQGSSETSPAADLTGYSARMHIREEIDSTEVLIELTTENGRIDIEPLTGIVTLMIDAEDTAALSFDVGVYDLELVSGSFVKRVARGKVSLSKEVTRNA